MPPPAPKAGAKGAADAPAKKKKEAPTEFCGCGVDTYRPPPKGKKLTTAPVEHTPTCNFQRTTCDAYPYLPRCDVCQRPCAFCGGKNRWCPHCYETPCRHRYKRVVHGWEPATEDAGPSSGAAVAASAAGLGFRPAGSMGGARRSTVKFVGAGA